MTPMGDSIDRTIQEHIDQVGWSVTAVGADRLVPQFAYTVGFTEHNLPELLISGLPFEVMHGVLNTAGRLAYDGARWRHGQHVAEIIVGFDAVIVDGAPLPGMRPGTAYARYGPARVRIQQIIWPDPAGRFPWQPGYAYPPQVQLLIDEPPADPFGLTRRRSQ